MRDFTTSTYRMLVGALMRHYDVMRVDRFLEREFGDARTAILRHDVDRDISAAIRCARALAEMGVTGTFYFRYPYTFEPATLRAVVSYGHEVGYHYEVLHKARGDIEKALHLFDVELTALREVCEVRTACMHGSPLSRWDNRAIWQAAKPSDFGLLGEPYISIDYSTVQYLTDTGRRWNGDRYSIRDHVPSSYRSVMASTFDVIQSVDAGLTARHVMLTTHPERWSETLRSWVWQLLFQNAKNVVKAGVAWRRHRSSPSAPAPIQHSS